MKPEIRKPSAPLDKQAAPAAQGESEKVEQVAAAKPPARAVAARLEAAQRSRFAEDFSQAVGVMMRAPQFKDVRIADLEWLLLPALLAGQSRVAFAKSSESGPIFPAALVLWAKVSKTVDQRLSQNLGVTPRLSAGDWTSGDILWLIISAGEGQPLAGLIEHLQSSVFQGRPVKVRTQQPDGTVVLKTLTGDQPPQ
jgi:cytolysin-activating lysine-acyltransferase